MEKKYYWIKLSKSFFFESSNIDFMLSQPNGSDYIVIYQMLCLMSCNNDGRLENTIGELIVPYTVEKITRDLKYFSIDTIRVALDTFLKLGLVYLDNSSLVIQDMKELVGSESSSAHRVRELRNRKALQCNTDVTKNVTLDIELEKEKEINKKVSKHTQKNIKKLIKAKNATLGGK